MLLLLDIRFFPLHFRKSCTPFQHPPLLSHIVSQHLVNAPLWIPGASFNFNHNTRLTCAKALAAILSVVSFSAFNTSTCCFILRCFSSRCLLSCSSKRCVSTSSALRNSWININVNQRVRYYQKTLDNWRWKTPTYNFDFEEIKYI